jgi:hypothetical protein
MATRYEVVAILVLVLLIGYIGWAQAYARLYLQKKQASSVYLQFRSPDLMAVHLALNTIILAVIVVRQVGKDSCPWSVLMAWALQYHFFCQALS